MLPSLSGRASRLVAAAVVPLLVLALLVLAPGAVPGADAGPASGVAQIAAGYEHSCSITKLDELYCWGRAQSGQLGFGASSTNQEFPRRVTHPDGRSWVSVTAGYQHSCAIDDLGDGWCWGDDGEGQVGNGAGLPPALGRPDRIVPPDGGTWTSLSAGRHTCGIDQDAQAWCWGRDDEGQLGNGPALTGNQIEPTPVENPGEVEWASIEVASGDTNNFGSQVTCGVTTKGDGFCWGDDRRGTLGDDAELVDVDVPTPVIDPPDGDWAVISPGLDHTCGVTTLGSALCWGSNGSRQLGTGGPGGVYPTPVGVATPDGVLWADVDASSFKTCGRSTAHVGYCWGGESTAGELGNGFDPGVLHAEPAEVASPPGEVRQIVIGNRHACSVDGAAVAWCWGSDGRGALGTADSAEDQHVPGLVDTDVAVPQQISFDPLDDVLLTDGSVELTVSATSGLPVGLSASPPGVCTVSGSTVALVAAGPCTVRAVQGGDEDWQPAPPVEQQFEVRDEVLISVSGLAATYDGTPKSVVVTTDPPGFATVTTYDGSPVAPTGARSYDVRVELDDAVQVADPVEATLVIAKAPQTISFDWPDDLRTFGPSQTLVASSSSGRVVTFSATGACAVAGDQLSPTDVGTCSVTASQTGGPNYLAATPVVREVTVRVGFSDVDESNPFVDDIHWLVDSGVGSGYADGTFGPTLVMRRQAMASFLWRLAGAPDPPVGAPTFSDVPASSPFATPIAWLAGTGITTGYADGTFRPTDVVSRQSVAAFLHRYVDWAESR